MPSTPRSNDSTPNSLLELRKIKLQELRTKLVEVDKVSGVDVYYNDPVGFARNCFLWPAGQALTDYQEEILAELAIKKRCAVRGPHGLGKTATNAIAALWFALTRDSRGVDWKVVTTAGAWRQLTEYLWPEIHKWAKRLRWDRLGRAPFNTNTELLTLSLRLTYGQAFSAASNQPALIEGAHADSLMYIYDESKAIMAETFDASEGAFSGAQPSGLPEAFALAQSTPGSPLGRFYEIHARRPGFDDWWTRHVTSAEAIAAGRISEQWIEQRRKQWGADSALFANRALGEFHADDEDGVIPISWIEAAHERWRVWSDAGSVKDGRFYLGVDVARGGGDITAFAHRHGHVVTRLERMDLRDTMSVAGVAEARLTGSKGVAVVDVIGIGSGVYDRLTENRVRTEAFTASGGVKDRDRSGEFGFVNARAAAWWHLRELLDPAYGPLLALPPDDLLDGDLNAPRWRVMSGARIQVESKDDIRKRLGRSTDTGDAVVQACWPKMTGPARSHPVAQERLDRPGELVVDERVRKGRRPANVRL